MTAKLLVRPEAEQDALEAFQYYEGIREGLGGQFLADVRRQLTRIRLRPALYSRRFRDMRRSLLKRFPYGVVYAYDERANTVHVLAIMHTAGIPNDGSAAARRDLARLRRALYGRLRSRGGTSARL